MVPPLAARQFHADPPLIDNKPQLKLWVGIHFDFEVKSMDEEPGEQ
jgi:hypothetical protein